MSATASGIAVRAAGRAGIYALGWLKVLLVAVGTVIGWRCWFPHSVRGLRGRAGWIV
jgi:hypothetical protein